MAGGCYEASMGSYGGGVQLCGCSTATAVLVPNHDHCSLLLVTPTTTAATHLRRLAWPPPRDTGCCCSFLLSSSSCLRRGCHQLPWLAKEANRIEPGFLLLVRCCCFPEPQQRQERRTKRDLKSRHPSSFMPGAPSSEAYHHGQAAGPCLPSSSPSS